MCFPNPECDTWSTSPWHCHAASGLHAREARHHAHELLMHEAQLLNVAQLGGVEGGAGAGGKVASGEVVAWSGGEEGAGAAEDMRIALRRVRR